MSEANYEPIEIQGYFRSHTHLPLWEVLDRAGIWQEVGIKVNFRYCDSPSEAEAALFEGRLDLVSGNHISPYALVAKGKPMVSLASPTNGVNDRLVSREPVSSLAHIRGKRVIDATVTDNGGGYNHIRGNHMLYVLEAGLELQDVRWLEIADKMSSQFRVAQFEAMKRGEGDVTFVTGNTDKYEQAGFSVLPLPRLPMINGPTLTTTVTALNKYDRFGERLVLAQVRRIHYARSYRKETEELLEALKQREPQARGVSYNSVAKLLAKPYPDHQAVANAYRLCCMKAPGAKELSPLALWDLHFLRQLDNSGFAGVAPMAPLPNRFWKLQRSIESETLS
jgi:ABC-type nitrate/sulfonate/bicarbonate transport system substrate-binding protein